MCNISYSIIVPVVCSTYMVNELTFNNYDESFHCNITLRVWSIDFMAPHIGFAMTATLISATIEKQS